MIKDVAITQVISSPSGDVIIPTTFQLDHYLACPFDAIPMIVAVLPPRIHER